MARKPATVFLFLLSLLTSLSTADFTFTDPTTTCTTKTVQGEAIYCCSGACYDGTTIQDSTGLCKGFNNGCLDAPTDPRCAINQVFGNTRDDTVDAGKGGCYLGNDCNWVRDIYTYTCCDCPAGFIAYHSYCDGPQGRYQSFCIGCDSPGENLSYDENTGDYSCTVGPGTIIPASTASAAPPISTTYCDVANEVSTDTTLFGDLLTGISSACKFTPNVATYASLAISLIATRLNPGNVGDLTSNEDSLLLVGAATGLAIAGLPAFIAGFEFGALVAADLSASCGAITLIGGGLTSVGIAASEYKKGHCSATKLRRRVESGGEKGLDIRTATNNPCAELVALFPTDYSIASNAQTACTEILALDASTIGDNDVQNAVTDAQQACKAVSNFPFLIQLEAFIKAVNDLVPYCDGFNTEATLYASELHPLQTTSSTNSHSKTSHSTKTTMSKSLHTISRSKATHTTSKPKSSHTAKSNSKYTTKSKGKSTPHATKTKPKPEHHSSHQNPTYTSKTNEKDHGRPHHPKEKETSCA